MTILRIAASALLLSICLTIPPAGADGTIADENATFFVLYRLTIGAGSCGDPGLAAMASCQCSRSGRSRAAGRSVK